uniref:Phosphatidylglycerophosphatase A n=1 Tax=candidate division WOR-3 bacterium TaxID=2052148 RepID=A0A7C4GCC0_UNCW3
MGTEIPEPASALGQSRESPRRTSRLRFFVESLVGTGFFTGYFPFAPATVTSLVVLPLAFFLSHLPLWHLFSILVFFGIGVPVATDLERVWGHDPGRVTIDEVVGTLVTFLLNPVSLWGLGVGFVLWRFFDIVKLPFIHRSQRLPRGWGIMIDDVLAGACANLTLRLLLLYIPVLRFR